MTVSREAVAFRRAVRAAVVVPAVFAYFLEVVGSREAATFAAFGSFALLAFADFGGPARRRVTAYVLLTAGGAGLVALGTVLSTNAWLAAAGMVLVGATVSFIASGGGALGASATTAILAYILGATVPGPVTDLPNRLAGWLVAGAAATVAALVLLPRRETPVDPPDAVTPPISVRLHDSVRTGVALGIAVLIADLASLKQGFWVALATLAVLRSTAFSTERRAVEAAVGTAIGFALSAALLAAVGVGRPALWVIVVVGSFLAADLPQLRGFLAGQAAFTVLVVALFNLSQPIGWRAGLVRIEDILIGAGVGLVVGLSLWPRARVSRS